MTAAPVKTTRPAARQRRAVKPPLARPDPRESTAHGVTWQDPYAWLRAENWQEVLRDPDALPADIGRILRAENRHTAAIMGPTRTLQRTLIREMRGRIREDDTEPAQNDGPFAYYSRYRKSGEHPIACRRPRDGGREEMLLDGDALAKGKEFFDFGEVEHSPDHRLLAWSADEAGSELFTIRVRDLSTRADLPDGVQGSTGEVVWAADSQAFYYVALDANHRPSRVLRHVLGTPQEADVLLHEEVDPGMFVTIGETQSGTFLVIDIGDHETSEVRLLDLADSDAVARVLAPRRVGHKYDVDHHEDRFIILSNREGAEDFALFQAPVALWREGTLAEADWQELVPHKPGCMIIRHVCKRGRLIRLEREDALPRIVIRDLATGHERTIGFDEEAYALGMSAGLEFDDALIRYTYASMARPAETWDYDMETGARTLIKRQEVPSGHDPSAYVVRRIQARAPDGALVPVSLLHRAGLALDGSAPCLLYGYGSYGSAMSAAFRVRPLSLVDRGFVYAIAHVRGGSEKGWGWYQAGKRHHKTNSFTDFIACAEALIAAGYTAKGRIVAEGGSAGGMLMGAVANMAPDLFAGIIADVPFVDVLNTILDETLPLTPPEWPEWGDPIRDKAAFETIRAYSPYENVRAQAYPPILALAGLTDPRVTYWEPAKWVQRLRATMTGGGPVLLQVNMSAGHGGASGRLASLKETALSYAFALTAVEGFGQGADTAGTA